MPTLTTLIGQVKSEGGFDVDDATVAGWVNERHREAVVRAKWLMAEVNLGQLEDVYGRYALPANVAEVDALTVVPGSQSLGYTFDSPPRYQRISTEELWAVKRGELSLEGDGGVFAPGFGQAGEKLIEIYPVVVDGGQALVGLASLIPEVLVGSSSVLVPDDLVGGLKDGAVALGLARVDERLDSAGVFEQRFVAMVEELRRRKNRRLSSQPQRLQLWKSDWR